MQASPGRLVALDSHGPPERRFDIVVMADGFSRRDLPRFEAVTGEFRRELFTTPPFTTLRALVNLWRVDRVGSGELDVRFAPGDGRLMTVDERRVLRIARAHGAKPDVVLVIVDSQRYAGMGGRGVAAVTTHADAARLALHELGHAAFDLADEYGGEGPAASGEGEPRRVNVTRESDPALVKWASLVTGDGEVGCFEGGDRTSLGVYRASRTCLMRSVREDFCAVCHRQISKVMLTCSTGLPS